MNSQPPQSTDPSSQQPAQQWANQGQGQTQPLAQPTTHSQKKLSPQNKGKRLKYILGGLVFLLLVVGAGAGYYLTQTNQDIRQQAAGPIDDRAFPTLDVTDAPIKPPRDPSPTAAVKELGINFKLSLAGVPRHEKNQAGEVINTFHPEDHGRQIQVTVIAENSQGVKADPVLKTVEYKIDGNQGYYQLVEPLSGLKQESYSFLIKGPVHRQLKYCRDGQKSSDQCQATDYVPFNPKQGLTLDLTQAPLQAGDLPIHGSEGSEQDGTVNGLDYSYLLKCLSKQSDPTCVSQADLDYSGKVTNYDLFLLMQTLSSAPDQV
ncbi:MAG: hypothetical protein GF381_03840 [Candidatus Pacebacteria bacterium]|nr:hypothetical protein [Candidatus Paceibacterota bacterium]